jgi:hypothetical protein
MKIFKRKKVELIDADNFKDFELLGQFVSSALCGLCMTKAWNTSYTDEMISDLAYKLGLETYLKFRKGVAFWNDEADSTRDRNEEPIL